MEKGGTSPFIVGIGGTLTPSSSSETALRIALSAAEEQGARTAVFGGAELAALPHYGRPADASGPGARLVNAIRAADGLIVATPAYHGSMSGLVKNALDYVEETAQDRRVYLQNVPVGLVVCAFGWQALGTTLTGLRATVHALRGWPTPFGAGINTSPGVFEGGACNDDSIRSQLCLVASQVVEAALLFRSRQAIDRSAA